MEDFQGKAAIGSALLRIENKERHRSSPAPRCMLA